jgi:hypothetical protein
MRILIASIFVISALPAQAQQGAWNFHLPLSERVRLHEEACYTNAPEAWKVGEERRAAWIASCLSESPTR